MGVWSYFGKDGLMLQSGGDLTTDRYGLATGRLLYKVPPERWDLMPKLGSAHPYARFAGLERRRVNFTPGFWQVACDYAGTEGEESDPEYELNPGVGNEPIQTHKDFVKTLAGTPKRPLNGAIFVDPQTGQMTKDDTPGKFEFSRFSVLHPRGQQNRFGGLESFLEANNTVWVKRWTRRSRPEAGGRALKIVSNPPGNAPSYDGHDWLEFPAASTKRGFAYACQQQWLLSGPRGWLKPVYNG